ncbi:MAG: type II toxin-antitoxin system HicA family toxin [Mangrovibacterium sp.]|jgi:predicted RNA binding protein YcfA (HicA-like mRNA interferase family)
MKRTVFIKYLVKNGCLLVREGASHSIYQNVRTGKKSTVARHSELSELMCKIICKQLEIPTIS